MLETESDRIRKRWHDTHYPIEALIRLLPKTGRDWVFVGVGLITLFGCNGLLSMGG